MNAPRHGNRLRLRFCWKCFSLDGNLPNLDLWVLADVTDLSTRDLACWIWNFIVLLPCKVNYFSDLLWSIENTHSVRVPCRQEVSPWMLGWYVSPTNKQMLNGSWIRLFVFLVDEIWFCSGLAPGNIRDAYLFNGLVKAEHSRKMQQRCCAWCHPYSIHAGNAESVRSTTSSAFLISKQINYFCTQIFLSIRHKTM